MTIGELIKKERERCEWSQTELSKKSGISSRSIGHYEHGQRDPQMITLGKILGAMGIRIEFLRMDKRNE